MNERVQIATVEMQSNLRRRIVATGVALASAAGLFLSTPQEAVANEGCTAPGDVCVWGDDGFSQFGMDKVANKTDPVPQRVTTLSGVTDLANGWYGNTLAVKTDGSVYTWGQYAGTTDTTPRQITGITDGATVAAGVTNYVLRKNQTVVGWGEGSRGQLGDGHIGSYDFQVLPITIGGLDNVKAIASMESTLIALLNDGTVKTLGNGQHGTLGNGSDGSVYPHGSATPVNVSGLKDITAVAAAPNEGFALDKNGSAWAWGQNVYDLVGADATADAFVPRKISGLSDIVSISASDDNALYALDTQGRVWFMGWDAGGSGSGNCHENQMFSTGPVQVAGVPKIADISGISTNGYAVTADGVAYGWGNTYAGRLGSASLPQDLADSDICRTPVRLDNLASVRKIIAGKAGFAIMGKPDVFTPAKLNYVALGDSYSSGEGNPPFINTSAGLACDRSLDAWPNLLAKKLSSKLKFMGNLACSGATTKALTQRYQGQPAELTAMSKLAPEIVTVTIGGNDADFSGVLTDCFLLNCVADGTLKYEKDLIQDLMPSKLLTAYKGIKAASKSPVVVVGYPRLFPQLQSNTANCGWLSSTERTKINELSSLLNNVMIQSAKKAGVTYVQETDALKGHELCTRNSWVNPITISRHINYSGHPKLAGQQAIEALVAKAINGIVK